ncbi:MAG TPA: PhnD/SsuA/transferrin family substrate-binding protein [Kineosporiaceae bacterium]|nr:PhnD/SsuA/transferrin family substrate-binding protein [Kineosporiaceae bacterium]
MTYQFAISPDVHARDLTNWFLLNTRIQRITGQAFRATIYDDFSDLHRAYDAGAVDLVFANAADTALLVREAGFSPVARPAGVSDEAAVVVAEGSPLHTLADLAGHASQSGHANQPRPAGRPGPGATLSVAATDAPDVERICRILLEPSDLAPEQISLAVKRNYVLVAKALITGQSEAGFFLRAAYDSLSALTRRDLRPLISSQIYVVSHALLVSPAAVHLAEPIMAGLEAMTRNPADQDLLAGLGAPHGWQQMSWDDVRFMIDLMDTLAQ